MMKMALDLFHLILYMAAWGFCGFVGLMGLFGISEGMREREDGLVPFGIICLVCSFMIALILIGAM